MKRKNKKVKSFYRGLLTLTIKTTVALILLSTELYCIPNFQGALLQAGVFPTIHGGTVVLRKV